VSYLEERRDGGYWSSRMLSKRYIYMYRSSLKYRKLLFLLTNRATLAPYRNGSIAW